MLVLGAGLQGCACAYDLLQQPAVREKSAARKKRAGRAKKTAARRR